MTDVTKSLIGIAVAYVVLASSMIGFVYWRRRGNTEP